VHRRAALRRLDHDGEPRGRRKLGERSVAVFDELSTVVASLEAEDLGWRRNVVSVRRLL